MLLVLLLLLSAVAASLFALPEFVVIVIVVVVVIDDADADADVLSVLIATLSQGHSRISMFVPPCIKNIQCDFSCLFHRCSMRSFCARGSQKL